MASRRRAQPPPPHKPQPHQPRQPRRRRPPRRRVSRRRAGSWSRAKLGDVANLDGHYWSPNGGLHVWLAYDTLGRYDQNLKPQPQLAESWDVSADFQTITVNLRKGVTYHSGREFTADDVVWNLTRALDPKVTVGIIGGFFAPGATFTAKDKNTVLLQAPQPWPTVFDMFHVVNMLDKENTDVASNKQTKAVGTGPFVFQEWKPGRVHAVHQEPQLLAIRPTVPGRDPGQRAQRRAVDACRPGVGRHDLIYNAGLQDYMR